jgi:hypothetical protein
MVGLAAATALLLFFVRSRSVSAINPAAEARGLAAVSGNVVPSASPMAEAPIARPAAADLAVQPPPVAPAASTRLAPTSTRAVTRTAPARKRAPKPAINKEFGF